MIKKGLFTLSKNEMLTKHFNDNNTLVFTLYRHEPISHGHDENVNFAIDVILALLEGYTPLIHFKMELEVFSENRSFLFDDPCRNDELSGLEVAENYISSHDVNWSYCYMDHETFRGKKKRHDEFYKLFYITCQAADREFVKAVYHNEPEVWLTGYLPKNDGTNFKVDELANLDSDNKNSAIAIATTNGNSYFTIFISPQKYPIEQLVSRAKSIAKRYNHTFELDI